MDNNNNDKTNSSGKNVVGTVAKGAGTLTKGAGTLTKGAGTATQVVGKTTKVAGAATKLAGTGTKYLGRGVSSVGKGVSSAGDALNGTGYGAVLGVPLKALGGIMGAAGNATEKIGNATEKIGNGVNKTGKKIDYTGKKLGDKGKDFKRNADNIGEMSKQLEEFGILNLFANYKKKLIVIGVVAAFVSIVMFTVILITPLMELGIIDISDISLGLGGISSSNISYTTISDNTEYWWPVGSSETAVSGGVTFASGTPGWTKVTSEYGTRVHPISGEVKKHSGVDIADGSAYGVTNVIAARDGVVTYPSSSNTMSCTSGTGMSSCGGGYGNYVMIQHSDGTVTLYAHLYENSITVRAGDTVKQGQVIAKMGSSGNSTGTHLHFEIRINGSTVDPLNYINIDNPRPVSTTSNYVTGDSNKQSVCLTLKTTGFSDDAIAALMTNMFYESSFNPTAIGDNGTSYGLCQWHNDRYDNLMTSFPDSYQTIGSQVEFLMYELENGYVSVYSSLLNESNSYSDLTYSFCSKFEMPRDTESTCKGRLELSETYYNYVKNNCQ